MKGQEGMDGLEYNNGNFEDPEDSMKSKKILSLLILFAVQI